MQDEIETRDGAEAEQAQAEPEAEQAEDARNTQAQRKLRWGMTFDISPKINLYPTTPPGQERFCSEAECGMIWAKYRKILKSEGHFVKNCLDAVRETENFCNNRGALTLLPVNSVLWLYKLGSGREETRKLYEGLAAGYRKHVKRCAGKMQNRWIRKSDIPLTERMLRMASSPGFFRENTKQMDFSRLQSLITALACAVSGGGEGTDESAMTHKTLIKAAPRVFEQIRPVQVAKDTFVHSYTAVWSPKNPWWNTTLFLLCELHEAVLLLQMLIYRWEANGKQSGQLEVARLDRLNFFTLLCVQLDMTASMTEAETMVRSAIAGAEAFW